MTRKTQRNLKRFFPYFIVLLIGALAVLGVALFTKPDKEQKEQTKESETTAPTETSTTEETTTEETSPTVAAVDVLQADALIDRYYEAKITDDADALNKIVDSETEYNVADLANESQFIDRYDNFNTYTIPGLKENQFIVYVKYDIYFNGISTGAPALNHFIITKNEDGSYTICDQNIDSEFQKYLQETEESKVVVDLKKQVEDELHKACEKNEDLKYLMAMLNNEPVTEASSEETETESISEETESEPSSEETSPESVEDTSEEAATASQSE